MGGGGRTHQSHSSAAFMSAAFESQPARLLLASMTDFSWSSHIEGGGGIALRLVVRYEAKLAFKESKDGHD